MVFGRWDYESLIVFFVVKEKTAYEIRLSVVGSEMWLRDRLKAVINGSLLCARTRKPKIAFLGS